jgi:hypothetical protein
VSAQEKSSFPQQKKRHPHKHAKSYIHMYKQLHERHDELNEETPSRRDNKSLSLT